MLISWPFFRTRPILDRRAKAIRLAPLHMHQVKAIFLLIPLLFPFLAGSGSESRRNQPTLVLPVTLESAPDHREVEPLSVLPAGPFSIRSVTLRGKGMAAFPSLQLQSSTAPPSSLCAPLCLSSLVLGFQPTPLYQSLQVLRC